MDTADEFDINDASFIKGKMIELVGLSAQLQYDMEQLGCYDDENIAIRIANCCFEVMGRLINVEELSKLDSYSPVCVNLRELVEDLAAFCRSRLRWMKGLSISFECSGEMLVEADPNRLIACLMNLIVNAVNNVENDGGIITVKVTKLSEKALIAVSDNGFGIDRGTLESILNDKNHTGGLAVVKKFCEKADSTLITDSDENCGFMASFRLPLLPDNPLASVSGRFTLPTGTFSTANVYISKIDGAILNI